MSAFLVRSDSAIANPSGSPVRVRRVPRGDRRLVPIGKLTWDRRGYGVLRFRVPRVRAGLYRVIIYCGVCVKGPGGSLIPASTPLRVLKG